jgi:hypothetical protein
MAAGRQRQRNAAWWLYVVERSQPVGQASLGGSRLQNAQMARLQGWLADGSRKAEAAQRSAAQPGSWLQAWWQPIDGKQLRTSTAATLLETVKCSAALSYEA